MPASTRARRDNGAPHPVPASPQSPPPRLTRATKRPFSFILDVHSPKQQIAEGELKSNLRVNGKGIQQTEKLEKVGDDGARKTRSAKPTEPPRASTRRKGEGEVILGDEVDEKSGEDSTRAMRAPLRQRRTSSAAANGAVVVNGHTTPSPPSKDLELGEPEPKKQQVDKNLSRNIDNVTFGDVSFKAWYPSWYPKEIIGEKGLDPLRAVGDGRKAAESIVVKDLYICNRCFAYTKEVLEWVRHCRCCTKEVPGRKIYTHGHEGVWSVWEVDGGVDTLFCQNLSLFAKLFLDNKSVFFDVSGFNYFLLVHNSTRQVIGFFSKEKMSWDNNNLACILIFPPWQRKGLGALLMGVSYEISRREEIMGGPEKPISDLGKKGYKRYWGAEIARWLLVVKETDRKKGKGMVDVERISRETWISPDDALGVMRDMGVLERAGKGRGEVERVRVDKQMVREWVQREGVDLARVVDPEGFVEGYGYKKGQADEEMGD
ncbi:uncharacterized protein BP5553_08231 [Venustampulla echinocandica]|uniref:histone acetyltransferase n=1 Tax=Venustampulla echinocandica TaxID=2656787 RepID=A0A370TG50_9HELO|nr:uncharacterized protein BP5553_08231 [Venustampulla echinocandica]RDL33863.1 hypothetical protein BP5553_08231 [Venustampulla echinocandica]